MNIGAKQIDSSQPVYVIAELGVNHDGSVGRALELTHAAARAGADAIKLQYFETDRLMSRAAKLAAYQKNAGESDPVSMLRRLELSIEDMRPVADLAHELGMHAIVTVFSVELVANAERIAWDAYKVASPDLVHRPLLETLAEYNRPLILSTGAATSREVLDAYLWLSDIDHRIAFMQCVSSYPTPFERASIGGMLMLEELTGCPVGYSDHTSDVGTGELARRFGATILEKHLTYNTAARGPDHAASLDPTMFAEYVRRARAAAVLNDAERCVALDASRSPRGVGKAEKIVLDIERDVRAVSRQSVTVTREIPAGHRLRREDLTIKRPGTGISACRFNEMIGRVARATIEADTPLSEDVLEQVDAASMRRAG